MTSQLYSKSDNSNVDNRVANRYFDPTNGNFNYAENLSLNQVIADQDRSGAIKLGYSMMIWKNVKLNLDYGFKSALYKSNFITLNTDNIDHKIKIDSLSSNYSLRVVTHLTNFQIGWKKKKLNLSVGGNTFFTGQRQIDYSKNIQVNRTFTNIAPRVQFGWDVSTSKKLSFLYAGQTIQPTIEQMQPFRKSINPLYATIGNPNLTQSFSHDITTSYSSIRVKSGLTFNVSSSLSIVENNISTSTSIDSNGRYLLQNVNLNSANYIYNWVGIEKETHNKIFRYGFELSHIYNTASVLINNAPSENKNTYIFLNPYFRFKAQDLIEFTLNNRLEFTKSSTNTDEYGTNKVLSFKPALNTTFYLPWNISIWVDNNLIYQPKWDGVPKSNCIYLLNTFIKKGIGRTNKFEFIAGINDVFNNNSRLVQYAYGNIIGQRDYQVTRRYFMVTLGWNFSGYRNSKL